jgi:hypothetical protein
VKLALFSGSFFLVGAILGMRVNHQQFENGLTESREALESCFEREKGWQTSVHECQLEMARGSYWPTYEDCQMLCEPAGTDLVFGCFPLTPYSYEETTQDQDACLQTCGCYRDTP